MFVHTWIWVGVHVGFICLILIYIYFKAVFVDLICLYILIDIDS